MQPHELSCGHVRGQKTVTGKFREKSYAYTDILFDGVLWNAGEDGYSYGIQESLMHQPMGPRPRLAAACSNYNYRDTRSSPERTEATVV